MILSDLSYLEVVSNPSSIVGGKTFSDSDSSTATTATGNLVADGSSTSDTTITTSRKTTSFSIENVDQLLKVIPDILL
jgi:hypothetical protein